MTTQWCGACAQEVEDLADKADRFFDLYGFEVRYLIGIFKTTMWPYLPPKWQNNTQTEQK